MQCLSKLVTGPYFNLFHRIGFNFKVLILGAQGLRPTYHAGGDDHRPACSAKGPKAMASARAKVSQHWVNIAQHMRRHW
jgi:hypothetical protein